VYVTQKLIEKTIIYSEVLRIKPPSVLTKVFLIGCFISTEIPNYIKLPIPNYIKLQIPNYIKLQITNYIKLQIPNYIKLQIPNYIKLQIPNYIKLQIPNYIQFRCLGTELGGRTTGTLLFMLGLIHK